LSGRTVTDQWLPSPPRWLTWLIPSRHREDLLADLAEECVTWVLPRLGRREARRWYRRRLVGCVLAGLKARASGLFRRGQGAPRHGVPRRGSPRARPLNTLDLIRQDIRFAFRSLLRSPRFAAIAVVTLGLGIGASTAIFSVLDGVMLKQLPFHEPDRLVVPWETFRTRNIMQGVVSYPNLEEWQARTRVFENIGGVHPEPYTLSGRGLPERIQGARANADFFAVLGVRQAQGRLILPEDDVPGAADVVVVSAGFWQRHFGDTALEGTETLILNDRPHTIIGVLQESFDYPIAVAGAELWTSATQDFVSFEHREWPRLIPVARMLPGITLAQARLDMDRVAKDLEEAFPETNTEHGANVVPLRRQAYARVTTPLLVILGAVGLVLFVACLNVASLLLVRGVDRRRELGVRAALGAGRLRVVQQLLTEGLLLGAAGGLLGVALARVGTGTLIGLLPADYPRIGEMGVDGRALTFAAAASLITCLAAALLPALRASRWDLLASLKGGAQLSAAAPQRRIQQTLVVAEVALAVVVLVGSGLLIRSFQRMHAVDPGFDPQGVLTFRVATGWSEMQVYERAELYSEASRRVAALPGVVSAGAGTATPVMGAFRATFQHDGEPELPMGERPSVTYLSVTPTYFETLGIPLLRGSLFGERDQRSSPGVALVNEETARQFWPDEDPLGQLFRPDVDITNEDPVLFQVVGVVGDVRDRGLDEEPSPTIYVPHTQQTWPAMTFVVRAAVEPDTLIPQIRAIIAELSQEASFSFRHLDDLLTQSTEERRFITLVMGFFAAMALTLSAVGVYGVLSYSVTQRRRELGLRRALGADEASVLGLVAKESARLLALGTVVGFGGSFMFNRLVASLLFGIATSDVTTYATACGILAVSGAFATYLPGRRASRIDPMVALREE
jgi:putative ABC transport system permease protein